MTDAATKARMFELVGAAKMAKAISSFVDAARYGTYKQIKDSGIYKESGLDWKQFCARHLGRDQKTINDEIRMLEQYGEPFLLACEKAGLRKNDLHLLGGRLPDDARADVRRGVVRLGDREFKVSEIPDNVDDFKSALELFNKELDVTKKSERMLERRVSGIDKEHKKMEKDYTARIRDLEAQIADPETPEEFAELWSVIERRVTEIAMLTKRLDFDEAHNGKADGPLRAKYETRIGGAEAQFTAVVQQMRDAVYKTK